MRQHRAPAPFGDFREPFGALLRDEGAPQHVVAGPPLRQLQQIEVIRNEVQRFVVGRGIDRLRPVAVVVVEFVEPGEQNPQLVLRTADRLGPRRILDAEDQFRQFLAVPRRDLRLPQFDRLLARTRRHAAAVVELHRRLDAHHDHRTGSQRIDRRLVEPAAAEFDPVGNAALLTERGRRTRGQSRFGHPFADDQFDSQLAAELLLRRSVPVGIHEEDVGLELADLLLEVHDAAPRTHPRILDAAQRLDHVEPFRLGIDRAPPLEFEDRAVAPQPHVEVTVGGRLLEEGDVSRMQEIVTAGNENFFRHFRETPGSAVESDGSVP